MTRTVPRQHISRPKPKTNGKSAASKPSPPSFDDPQRDFKRLRCEQLQIQIDKLNGDLIRIELHEAELAKRSNWIVEVLQVLPGRLAPLVAGRPAKECREVIREICDGLQKMAYGGDKE